MKKKRKKRRRYGQDGGKAVRFNLRRPWFIPRERRFRSSFALLPHPPFAPFPPPFLLERHRPPENSAPFLPLSFRLSRGEFSGESRFLIYDRSRTSSARAFGQRRKGGNEKKRVTGGWKRASFSLLPSFISSHFRRSPRYPSEFTMYRIYRSDDTYLHRATDYRDSLRGGEEEVKWELTFNARRASLPTVSIAKFRVCT